MHTHSFLKLLALVVVVGGWIALPVAGLDGVGAPDPPPAADEARPAATEARLPYTAASVVEQRIIESMLESPDWAFRTLALMRLARYEGDAVRAAVLQRLSDASWQVRCFAIHHAWLHGYEIDPARFAEEPDPRVIRTAIRYGVTPPNDVIDRLASDLSRQRTVDAQLMAIELAAASTDERLRRQAAQRVIKWVQNMSPQVAAVISRRLAAVLQLDPAPQNLFQWRAWAAQHARGFELPRPAPPGEPERVESPIADADADTFTRLRDYMGALRQRNLELVIALDATNSMTPVIDAVKADVDALILFLSDISSTLRLGILAFRDHDNPGQLIEAHPFSTNLESLRNFLFGLQTPGGDTYPEAVFDAFNNIRKFDWQEQAEREIILIGDAPPHEETKSDLGRLLRWYRNQGFAVHSVHVPMEFPAGYLERMNRPAAMQAERDRQAYNLATEEVFLGIANTGGGKSVQLDVRSQNELVRSIMKLTLERQWWPYFDEFYDAYLELCR